MDTQEKRMTLDDAEAVIAAALADRADNLTLADRHGAH